MSIQYVIPKTSRFVQCNVPAVAAFNVPVLGVYDFGGQAVSLLTMQPNSIYFIERVNVGGTIPEEEFLSAIATLPTAVFFNSVTRQQVLPKPLPIVNYIDNQEVNGFVWTDQPGQDLQLVVSGRLLQVPFLVGVNSVTVNIQVNIYDINDNGFIQQFKSSNRGTGFGLAASPVRVAQSFDVGRE